MNRRNSRALAHPSPLPLSGDEASGGSVATTGGGEASGGGVATTGGGEPGTRVGTWLGTLGTSVPSAGLTEDHGTLRDFANGYSQPEFFFDLCFNVPVRPTRISPRQSGAAGPRSTLRGCAARPGSSSSVTYCSPAAPTGPSP